MVRAIWLTVLNEARLLRNDPIVLFMLLFAPVVIITVAGYSLGSLYGTAASSFVIPIVDHDRGPVAAGLIEALRSDHTVAVDVLEHQNDARRMVSDRDRTPIAIEIPAGTSAGLAAGHQPRLILFVDPARRIEVDALELRIDQLCRKVTEHAQTIAQEQITQGDLSLRKKLESLSADIEREQREARLRFARSHAALERSIDDQIDGALRRADEEAEATIRERESQSWAGVRRQLAEREAILRDLQRYLARLRNAQHAFEDWMARLKTIAGSHASDIPAPPAFPASPPEEELATLSDPITPPKFAHGVLREIPGAVSIKIPPPPVPRADGVSRELAKFDTLRPPTLPGDLSFIEEPAIDGEAVVINAFDQYVPGFGITFLLIGMMLGIALTLFDEREWGTLNRLRGGGAPLSGMLLGKIFARFIVGILQMVVLFAVGWALFGITLGRNPAALLIPTIGISFASAALGLVIASVSRAHDSVMPLGVTVSMAIAAIGGCWWPLDFEPGWMREIARWMPTTWTMQAFNDLMIRNRTASETLWPLAATIGLGMIFLAVGIARFASVES